MKFDGVNFNPVEVAKMSREAFVARHIGVFWQDRDEKTRKKMLGKVYDTIVKQTPASE